MSKKYQKKSASTPKRSKKGHSPRSSLQTGETHGVMGGMVHGFRRAVGSGGSDQPRSNGIFLTAALLVLALAVAVWFLAQ